MCTTMGFVNKYKGAVVRNGQCVALYRQYVEEVWGLPALEGLGEDGGAEGLFYRYDKDIGPMSRKYLDCIAYDGTNCPQSGDVIIFRNTPTNKYGHVAIVLRVAGDGNSVDIFEQNGLAAMANDTSKMGAHVSSRMLKSGTLGWLRKKV